jgi:hypothetical protein
MYHSQRDRPDGANRFIFQWDGSKRTMDRPKKRAGCATGSCPFPDYSQAAFFLRPLPSSGAVACLS